MRKTRIQWAKVIRAAHMTTVKAILELGQALAEIANLRRDIDIRFAQICVKLDAKPGFAACRIYRGQPQ